MKDGGRKERVSGGSQRVSDLLGSLELEHPKPRSLYIIPSAASSSPQQPYLFRSEPRIHTRRISHSPDDCQAQIEIPRLDAGCQGRRGVIPAVLSTVVYPASTTSQLQDLLDRRRVDSPLDTELSTSSSKKRGAITRATAFVAAGESQQGMALMRVEICPVECETIYLNTLNIQWKIERSEIKFVKILREESDLARRITSSYTVASL